MPKMKTHRATAKRLRLTGTGKVVRRRAFRKHILEKKSSKRKRRLHHVVELSAPDARRARKLLGG
jgi:large subunit ribosomal protein L35